MSRIDYARHAARERVARKGADDLTDMRFPGWLAGVGHPRPAPVSKAALRDHLNTELASISREVRCQCGHSARVLITAKMQGVRFRCKSCGAIGKVAD